MSETTRGSGRIRRPGKVVTPTFAGLTAEMKLVMRKITNGADVWGHGEAMCIREIERRFPGLVTITKPMDAPKDGAKQQPYFGAILTTKGRAALAWADAHGPA